MHKKITKLFVGIFVIAVFVLLSGCGLSRIKDNFTSASSGVVPDEKTVTSIFSGLEQSFY